MFTKGMACNRIYHPLFSISCSRLTLREIEKTNKDQKNKLDTIAKKTEKLNPFQKHL